MNCSAWEPIYRHVTNHDAIILICCYLFNTKPSTRSTGFSTYIGDIENRFEYKQDERQNPISLRQYFEDFRT